MSNWTDNLGWQLNSGSNYYDNNDNDYGSSNSEGNDWYAHEEEEAFRAALLGKEDYYIPVKCPYYHND